MMIRPAVIVLSCVVLCACSQQLSEEDVPRVHETVLTLDTHVDIPFNFATDEVRPLDGDLQVNLQTMRSGGLDAAFFIVYVGQTERTPQMSSRDGRPPSSGRLRARAPTF